MALIILIRGGGDIASGVALRLHHSGLRVLITELPQPLAIRRLASFAEAIYAGEIRIEDVTGRFAKDLPVVFQYLERGEIPVLVDPELKLLKYLRMKQSPIILVDGRMIKKPPEFDSRELAFVIGLGPGFTAGENCHAVIETKRGHQLGRVIWNGAAEADSGIPEPVNKQGLERVLRSPADGYLKANVSIGDHLEPGQLIAEVNHQVIRSPFCGVLRGLIHPKVHLTKGMKIGDVDPRDDASFCTRVSDKAMAVGGGVLEAILSQPDLRPLLWEE